MTNLYDYLEINKDKRELLSSIKIKNENELIELFYPDEEEFFSVLNKDYKDNYLVYLYLYLKIALRLYALYIKANLPLSIYFDTISDFKIWIDKCREETSSYGLKEVYWLNEHLRMKIFKLKRLQFQKVLFTKDLFDFDTRLNLIGKEVFFIHIPKGEALDKDKIIASFNLALDFYSLDEIHIFCDSWLLSPDLKNLLDNNSNIVSFMNMFTILYTNKDSDPIHRYLKADSRLLKAVKEYEKTSRTIGTAVGYLSYRRGE